MKKTNKQNKKVNKKGKGKEAKDGPVVMVACMNNSGYCSEYRANSMFGLGWFLAANGIKAKSGTWDFHPISLSRNVAIKNFLEEKRFTHIFFIDSDNMPEHPAAIVRLLSYDEPIVCGWYLSRKNPRLPVVLKIEGKYSPKSMREVIRSAKRFPKWRALKLGELMTLKKDKKGLVQVDGVGAGCMLIKREALSHLEQPYFYEDPINPDSFGEDLFFGLNCKIHKVPIKVDLNVFCGHFSWGIIGKKHLINFIRQEQALEAQKKLLKTKKPPM